MSNLKIALLGPPEVYHADQLLAIPDRKALALLVYLAVEGGAHARQRLTRLFWPESDMAHGRAALRNTLLHLRHVLGEDTQPDHRSHLMITRDSIGLNVASSIDLDLHALQAAWTLIQELPSREAVQGEVQRTLISQLQHAADMYRGGFLEEFTLRDTLDFDNWVGLQRSYWYSRIGQVFAWLSQMQSEEGAIEQAIATVDRWLSLDPLNEDIYLRLMQLHFSTGNRAAALKAYETCLAILMTELHAKPSPKMVALADFIRHSSPPHRASRHEQTGRGRSASRTLLEIPFVGRGAELTRLMTLYEKASSGQFQVVMIEGEAGIGKSRLAAAYLDWAKAQGASVLKGRAFKTSSRLSYQLLIDALRSQLEQGQDLHHLLSDIWLAELSQLLPELRERYPGLPPPTVDEAFASSRLFEAIARLGRAFAARTPLLLFADDLQWADAATLDVFHYVGRRWTESATPALLLLTMRTDRRVIAPQLAEWLTSVRSDVPLTRLELAPLSAKDTLQIVQSFSAADGEQEAEQRVRPSFEPSSHHVQTPDSGLSPERFGQWLFAETKGQPFFMIEMLETLLARGILVPRLVKGKDWVFDPQTTAFNAEVLDGTLPSTVRETILIRLAQLGPAARELLAAGAVLDHDFTFEDLCQVAHLAPQEGLSALDEVLGSLLLRESRRQRGGLSGATYVFAHDKIREVVDVEAGDARRRIFHGRALKVLKRAGAPAAELAYHAFASGLADPAFRWSTAAGDEAMKVFAARDAIGHYEQAHQLLTEPSVVVPATRLHHLLAQLGRAYELCNDFAAAHATYQTMLVTARQMHDPAMECAALNHQAVLASEDFSNLERAKTLLQEALNVAERNNDRVGLAETQWSLARMHYYVLNLEASLAHGRQAYALAHELGQQDLTARSLNMLAYTTRALGKWEEAASIAEEARQLYAAQGNRVMEADCLGKLADAQINCGRPLEGIAAARAAYAISLEIEHNWSQANSGFALTRGLVELGSYEEALEIALQSTGAARTLTFSILLLVNLAALGLVYQALLVPEKAREAHLEALKVSTILPSQRYTEMCAALLCTDCVLADDWEAASAYARQALEARDPHVVVFPEVPRWPETEALVREGLSELAAEDLRVFEERFGTSKRCRITYLRAQAVLAQSRGESDQAVACLQEAIAGAKERGLLGELWQAEAALGRVHLAREEREPAAPAFARAAAIVQKLAGDIKNDALRSHFLESPQVRHVLMHMKE